MRNLELPFVHEPYRMTPLDQQFNNFELGVTYPFPIVDLKSRRKQASDILWNMKNNSEVRNESFRILNKHTINNRFRMVDNKD